MPILSFISIDHMFRKSVTDKDFSQIQIHECYACWEEKTCKWVKTCISYINVYYTALFNIRSWPMHAFSHVYMWWKVIRMKKDWQTDTMSIYMPLRPVTMLVTFSIKKQVYQCTTIMHAPFSKTNKSKKSSSDKWVKTRSYVLQCHFY